MAINPLSLCEISPACSLSLKSGPAGHLVKVDHGGDGKVVKRCRKKIKSMKSPYLHTGDKIQFISSITERKMVHKKTESFDTPFNEEMPYLYRANSDEFKGMKQKPSKKVKKSVLTLPNEQSPMPQATCTVSDLNEAEYERQNEKQPAVKRIPLRNRRKRPVPIEFEFYDRDARHYSQMNLEMSSTDIMLKHIQGDGKTRTRNSKKQTEIDREIQPHDVWAVLRDINRFQFNPSPPISIGSIRSDKKKVAYRRRNNHKGNRRLIETTRTEEISYVANIEFENPVPQPHSRSRSSSCDRVTVIDNKELQHSTGNVKQIAHETEKRIQDKYPRYRNVAIHNTGKKDNTKIREAVDKIQSKNSFFETSLDSSKCLLALGAGDKLISREKETFGKRKANAMNDPMVNYRAPTKINISDATNRSANRLAKEGHRSIINKIANAFLGNKEDIIKKKKVIQNAELSEAKALSSQKRRPRLVTTMPSAAAMPKLDVNDIKKKLCHLRFPVVVMAKDQIGSDFEVIDNAFPQFDGLDNHIWPFMTEWDKKGKQKTRGGQNSTIKHFDPNNLKPVKDLRKVSNEMSINKPYKDRNLRNVTADNFGYKKRAERSEKLSDLTKDVDLLRSHNFVNKPKHKPNNLRQIRDKMLRLIYKKPSDQLVECDEDYPTDKKTGLQNNDNFKPSIRANGKTYAAKNLQHRKATNHLSEWNSEIPDDNFECFLEHRHNSKIAKIDTSTETRFAEKVLDVAKAPTDHFVETVVNVVKIPTNKAEQVVDVVKPSTNQFLEKVEDVVTKPTKPCELLATFKKQTRLSRYPVGVRSPSEALPVPVSTIAPTRKQPSGKGKLVNDFIDNVIKKVKSGIYYVPEDSRSKNKKVEFVDIMHQNVPDLARDKKEYSLEAPHSMRSSKSDLNMDSCMDLVKLPEACDPLKAIPGFDDSLPGLEIKSFDMNRIAIKQCSTNILVQFDVKIFEKSDSFVPNISENDCLCIPLSVSDSKTRIFKYSSTIVNAVLPAQLCTLLPRLIREQIKTCDYDTLSRSVLPLGNTPSHLSMISEGSRCESPVTLVQQLPLQMFEYMSPLLKYLLDGRFTGKKSWRLRRYIKVTRLMGYTSLPMIPKVIPQRVWTILVRPSMNLRISWKKPEPGSYPPLPSLALKKISASNTVFSDFSSILERMTRYYNFNLKFNLTTLVSPVKLTCYNNSIKVDVVVENQGVEKAMSVTVSNVTLESLFNGYMDRNTRKSKLRSNDLPLKCIEYIGAYRTGKTVRRELLPSKPNRNGSNRFVKLYKKCKSTSSIVIEKCGWSLNKITTLDDFFQCLGSARSLASLFDGPGETKILSAVSEMKSWITEITPRQAMLVLLLINKKETPNLDRFRALLLQGIAVNRITRSSELDMEIEVIENENVKFVTSDGTLNWPAPITKRDSLYEELQWIAKTTASDHKRPFDETSETLLKSLLEKRKKLNPSYLRVMARYVGLGLLKTPTKH